MDITNILQTKAYELNDEEKSISSNIGLEESVYSP